LLTNPAASGIAGPAFDVIIPSLPGYGFSERPARTGVNYRYIAGLWHRLMRGLGYERYGAQGGDFGAGVATFMALDDSEPMIGLHLNTLEISPYTGPGSRPLSEAERAYLERYEAWWQAEGGYKAIQSTKPQTLGYALNDSPAGLAAWILEKWRAWADSHGNLTACFSPEFLLITLTIYWATQTITPSMRDYFDNRWSGSMLGVDDVIQVPTGFAVFAHQFSDDGEPPREWAERLYNVRQWTVMPSGGHFAATEESERLARDIAAFFAER
jgi:pimeloyl-ACP methyl ester carboxylesterase